ncbi:MAG: 50S ribosomal protein L14 [Candidatus Levybacteria bacterium RIFCSPHIGHO2_12_FULL_38_12]|nr:MAG: 50S ribosomal protein L14 [Candidatus Levybacteria bacterium RIFCSPHIGHO2_01_FULL_38_12]OGH21964.1 MAG: 50S ribosomal protein L14 [Candidatus Levybacteria bacterium RIFCSPHIGHO2_02_FULL_37_18]OGH23036.1 MAG: 50S ribosomal protein L14 [Candidatus Levybacteria bacterium RIFCSPHIGHO2_12_FULL_38_12]OGH33657.1 MAG: 50S ribosomal protein L14 [Candidatus Levybacteria bacterium RIFCSPLOWO2_01_FULL_37_20]OGH44563.1 MAG: 50S ribosomal protein L14 [Candidatus Levybacteria bacterium RIFCSPLOWO2_02_
MIQHRSILKSADNSGAKSLMVIHIFGGSKRKFGYLGDVINCVVKQASAIGAVKDGEIVKAVVVRTHKEFKRNDGSYIRFSDNAAVIIDNPKDKNPIGTRIFGPIAREVRDKGFIKIASMAVEVV